MSFTNFPAVLAAVERGFGARRALVVGDVMLDRHIWGEVRRISPEAPVPVVHVQRQTERPGGAGNVALNLKSLGLDVAIGGYVGEDSAATGLRALLREAGVDAGPLVAIADRPTVTKTRILGAHQQMLRLDTEADGKLDSDSSRRLLAAVAAQLDARPAVAVLSDYGKGTLEAEVTREIVARAHRNGVPLIVDPKGRDWDKYRGATAITPNLAEMAAATGCEPQDTDGLLEAADRIRRELELDMVVLTRSAEGISLIDSSGVHHAPSRAREVFDVSGAGDTVAATFAAGIAAGLERLDIAHLANVAAGIAISYVGPVAVTRDELDQALRSEQEQGFAQKVCNLDRLLGRLARWRGSGQRVVFTNGCFDLLHVGHVSLLDRARQEGDRLVIGLNTDRSVQALKGPERPVVREQDRARILASLASVDAVVLFDEETPLELLRAIRPDVLVKGDDYSEDQVVGAADVRSWGGRVALLPLVQGHSSSRVLERIRGRKDP